VRLDPESLIPSGFRELQELLHPHTASAGQEEPTHSNSQKAGKQQTGNPGAAALRQPVADGSVQKQQNKDDQRDGQDIYSDAADLDSGATRQQNADAQHGRDGSISMAAVMLRLHTTLSSSAIAESAPTASRSSEDSR
jgi:hypothetical protein